MAKFEHAWPARTMQHSKSRDDIHVCDCFCNDRKGQMNDSSEYAEMIVTIVVVIFF